MKKRLLNCDINIHSELEEINKFDILIIIINVLYLYKINFDLFICLCLFLLIYALLLSLLQTNENQMDKQGFFNSSTATL